MALINQHGNLLQHNRLAKLQYPNVNVVKSSECAVQDQFAHNAPSLSGEK
jgi:hypothetical protein